MVASAVGSAFIPDREMRSRGGGRSRAACAIAPVVAAVLRQKHPKVPPDLLQRTAGAGPPFRKLVDNRFWLSPLLVLAKTAILAEIKLF